MCIMCVDACIFVCLCGSMCVCVQEDDAYAESLGATLGGFTAISTSLSPSHAFRRADALPRILALLSYLIPRLS